MRLGLSKLRNVLFLKDLLRRMFSSGTPMFCYEEIIVKRVWRDPGKGQVSEVMLEEAGRSQLSGQSHLLRTLINFLLAVAEVT